MDLIEEPAPGNSPEYTVSDISGAVKRLIEGEFTHVRVRGEVGRVVLARTGHLYFDLKDDLNVLAAVSWKGQAARLSHRPEEGMEVIATGRLTQKVWSTTSTFACVSPKRTNLNRSPDCAAICSSSRTASRFLGTCI